VNPDLGVALGAAIQGGMIAGADVGPVLVDITPHTLGIQALGLLQGFHSIYAFAPIISRNSPLPATRSEIFATSADGQESAEIKVYQGERDDVRHNQLVGDFLLDGLSDVDAGNQVLVRFDLDLDGILKVSAIERSTGRAKSLVIDNAVERLRRSHVAPAASEPSSGLQAAPAFRIDRFIAPSEQPAPASAPSDSPELRAARARAWELVEKARRLAEQTNPQDAGDLRRVIGQIESAVGENAVTRVTQLSAELEDLVFYLEDA